MLAPTRTESEMKLSRLLSTIVFAIGQNTPHPEIEHFHNQAAFTLAVHPRDQGRMIGAKGATIWAIQTIFYFAGLAQCGYSYTVKLLEPDAPEKDRKPFRFNPKWDRSRIRHLLDTIVDCVLPGHASYTLDELDDTTALVSLKIQKYLSMNLNDPNFAEAFANVVRASGMSSGVNIKAEAIYT
jgi:predicted RNA-binding protein YlqC (UPF0109 family)